MLKIKLYVFGGFLTIVAVAFVYNSYDLKANYSPVEGTIISVATDCYVKSGRKKIVDKQTNKISYMNCRYAPMAAQQFGFKENDIRKRATVKYSYISPIDGNYYEGEFTRTGKVEAYVKGRKLSVFAHNEKPENSRTASGNVIVDGSKT